ncbi:T9SS type A sorting domain-containing protein, partial [Ignavibacteria bacterium CHB1]
VNFNASNLSSGVYFYKLEAGDFIDTKRMLLVK